MEKSSRQLPRLTPSLILRAYAAGIFPMAESRGQESIFWVDPDIRGIIPLDALHVPRSLCKKVRRGTFEVRCDSAFAEVIHGCAEETEDRRDTWINDQIIDAFTHLHRHGIAHSLESWREGRLAGGLYGIAMGGVFFGESMFSRVTDASKVILVHLVARLRLAGFRLLDVQFVTEHLKRFGVQEIPRRQYRRLLDEALATEAVFETDPDPDALSRELELVMER